MHHLTELQRVSIQKFAALNGVQIAAGTGPCDDIHVITRDPASKYAGMQILHDAGVYEVSQYQAGPRADKMYIYTRTADLMQALKSLIVGNSARRKILEIID